ncbi:MAG: DUF7450 family protein [Nitrososphaera sp.]
MSIDERTNKKHLKISKKHLSIILAAVAAVSLLVPFQNLVQNQVPPTAEAQAPERALKCYPITNPRVSVKDQFGTERVFPGPAKLLCELAVKHSDVRPTISRQWKVYTIAGSINPGPVTLSDQFGHEAVDPGKGTRLLNPALKNDKGSLSDPHFKGYPIAGRINPPTVLVADQFGVEKVDPRPATLLLTPALKNGVGTLTAPHWKCYPITGTINPPVVTLTDQFGTEKVDPRPATLLCTLTLKSLDVAGQQISSEPKVVEQQEQ